ncbi:uncharacterized protein LOC121838201 [Ixodes scapularis]|uniref:uncharacterized protein LOC121838201 n=1 Tax=Ixodes scapularis TaxID=6945 RepID=UPI001C37FA26|nr:uncharacterized protein LOC121838201 [Ixodes scapularis]
MASSAPPAVLALLLLVSPLLEAYNTGVPKHPQDRGTGKVTPNRTPGHQKPDVTQGAAASEPRSSKSHGYYDLYQGGYDKGFSDLIYWVPLIIIFGAGIIFLPVLGAMFATLAAGTAGAAVSTTVAGRRRRDVPSMEGALHMLRTLETAFEKYRTLSAR